MPRTRTLSLLIAALAPLAAWAHVHLDSSTPAKNSTLPASPEQVVLVFGEAVQLKALTLARAGERQATPLGPLPKSAAAQLAVPLPKLADGAYVLTYTYVGDDQHEMSATIPFKVASGAAPAKPAGTTPHEHHHHAASDAH